MGKFDVPVKDEMETAILEKIKYAMQISFPHWHMQGSLSKKLDYASVVIDHAVYQFETFFWGKQEKREETTSEAKTANISWPSTWWEHWKEQHAPKWFKERWPVKYSGCEYTTEINNHTTIHETRVCPHLNLSTSNNNTHVAFLAGK